LAKVIKSSKEVKQSSGIEMNVKKYLQLYGSEIHEYTKAYMEQWFRGIIKSKGSWETTINKFMEGGK